MAFDAGMTIDYRKADFHATWWHERQGTARLISNQGINWVG
jgi:hypothetical protein